MPLCMFHFCAWTVNNIAWLMMLCRYMCMHLYTVKLFNCNANCRSKFHRFIWFFSFCCLFLSLFRDKTILWLPIGWIRLVKFKSSIVYGLKVKVQYTSIYAMMIVLIVESRDILNLHPSTKNRIRAEFSHNPNTQIKYTNMFNIAFITETSLF